MRRSCCSEVDGEPVFSGLETTLIAPTGLWDSIELSRLLDNEFLRLLESSDSSVVSRLACFFCVGGALTPWPRLFTCGCGRLRDEKCLPATQSGVLKKRKCIWNSILRRLWSTTKLKCRSAKLFKLSKSLAVLYFQGKIPRQIEQTVPWS